MPGAESAGEGFNVAQIGGYTTLDYAPMYQNNSEAADGIAAVSAQLKALRRHRPHDALSLGVTIGILEREAFELLTNSDPRVPWTKHAVPVVC